MNDATTAPRIDRFRPWIAALSLAFASPILLLDPVAGEDDPTDSETPPASASETSTDAGTSGNNEPDARTSPPPTRKDSEGPIRFDHGTHRSADCTECHDPESGEGMRPSMQDCAGCHGGESEPQLSECSGCHVGYDNSVDKTVEKPADWRAVRPAPMVAPPSESSADFDHAAHLEALGGGEPESAACNECHAETNSGEPTVPGPASCDACHGDESSNLEPANHTVGWLRRHGDVARSSSETCMDCHTEDDCSSCHDGERAEPFSVHPPNFETLHAAKARGQREDCADCHNADTFCTKCHQRADVATPPQSDPPARYTIHPDDWTDPDAPRNHAVMARRDIEDCASCHTERDCVTCHESVDPHPPEFRLECKQWLESNPRPCAKCHGDLDRLRRRCL